MGVFFWCQVICVDLDKALLPNSCCCVSYCNCYVGGHSLVVCGSANDLREMSSWDGKGPASRCKLIHQLQGMLHCTVVMCFRKAYSGIDAVLIALFLEYFMDIIMLQNNVKSVFCLKYTTVSSTSAIFLFLLNWISFAWLLHVTKFL